MKLGRAGGIFERLHRELVGVSIDFSVLRTPDDPELRQHALSVWGYRVHTEFRSIQVMARFVADVLAAGDPLEVWAGAADAVLDEIRHTALCVGMVEALGGEATLPTPVDEPENPEFDALPAAQRALGTAVSMLAVSETLSTGFIEDLHARCSAPVVSAVLSATIADEDTHRDYGWDYVQASLSRFDGTATEYARMVAHETLRPHRERYEPVLAGLAAGRRHLDDWPDSDLIALGLHSPEREALVFEATYQTRLKPRLASLDLLDLL
jgi:hypothetical protein